jgi:hypothetical protein
MLFPLSPGGARPPGAIAAVALAGASLVATAAVGSIFLSTARDAWAAIAAAGPADPAAGILLVAALGGMLLSAWLGLGTTLTALSALPGAVGRACRRLAGRIAPAAARKIVAFVLGTTLTAALVPGSALAGTGHEAPRPAVVAAGRPAVGAVRDAADAAPDASFRFVSEPAQDTRHREAAPPPSWSPERPAPPQLRASPADGIVVHRGDTLWSIAARHLDPMATAAVIDAECHRWFAANRDVIGQDPDLILPGQLLSPPPSPTGDS